MEDSKIPALSIIVPVRNEEKNIVDFLSGILAVVEAPYEVIIVFDDETDKTPAAVLKAFDPGSVPFRIVRNEVKPGFFAAIRKGISISLHDHVVVTMADGSDNASDINLLRRSSVYNNSDIVCASRFTGSSQKFPLKQQLAKSGSRLLQILTGLPTSDITNNFKLYRKSLFSRIALSESSSFDWSMQLTTKAYLAGHRISEIETRWSDRIEGKSNFNLPRLLPRYIFWFGFLLIRKWTSVILTFGRS